MASRGKGRGKGLGHVLNSCTPTVGGKTSEPPKVPKNIESLGKYLHSLNESNFDLYGGTFAAMVAGYSSTEGKLQEAVDLIYNTTVSDRDNAKFGSMVCEKVMCDAKEGTTFPTNFRKNILLRFQTDYKMMDQLRTQSIESWLGIFAFLCHFYFTIKVGGEPIMVMGKPILMSVESLLQKSDLVEDEIDCICTHLKLCGESLESKQPIEFEKILTCLRKLLIGPNSRCMSRCAILELVEYKYMGWKDPDKVLDKFYVDALVDAVAQDELRSEK